MAVHVTVPYPELERLERLALYTDCDAVARVEIGGPVTMPPRSHRMEICANGELLRDRQMVGMLDHEALRQLEEEISILRLGYTFVDLDPALPHRLGVKPRLYEVAVHESQLGFLQIGRLDRGHRFVLENQLEQVEKVMAMLDKIVAGADARVVCGDGVGPRG